MNGGEKMSKMLGKVICFLKGKCKREYITSTCIRCGKRRKNPRK